jgi:two-component system, NarL family, sensor kinase
MPSPITLFARVLFACASLVMFNMSAQNQNPDSIQIRVEMSTGIPKAEALNDGVSLFVRSDLNKAEAYVQQTYDFAKQEKNVVITAYANLNDGLLKAAQGKADTAIQLIEIGRKMALNSKNSAFLIRAGVALGRIYIAAGKPEKALTNLYNVLKLLERTPQPETEMKVRVNITWAYLELKRYRDCVAFGRKTLTQITPAFQYMTPYITNNMAASYGALHQLDSTRFFVQKGLPIAERRNDYNLVANAYYILGNSYSDSGDFNKAIEQFQKAKPYREKLGNPFFMVADLYVLSDLYHKKGDYANGIKSGLEALAIADKNNLTLKFEGVYQALARNYEAMGDFKNSTKYYGLLAAAKDSVYQNANASALADMQTKYETEKKEQQITLLNSENELKQATIERNYFLIGGLTALILLTGLGFYLWRYRDQQKQKAILQEQKERLREAQLGAVIDSQEKERKRFASDLHDGMGQLISALHLNINSLRQNRTPDKRDNLFENSEQILADIHTEIRNIAFNLMPPVLIKEGLLSGLSELARRINKSGSVKVSVVQHDIPQRFNEVSEISLYRVIQELLSNILKYANATQVTISFTGFDDEIVITVEDDGDGYDLEKFQNNEGNGWRNINSRLNLIKANIEFDVVSGRKNNTVIITIPKISLQRSEPVVASQSQV